MLTIIICFEKIFNFILTLMQRNMSNVFHRVLYTVSFTHVRFYDV